MKILHDGARCYTTGAYIVYNAKKNEFVLAQVSADDDVFYNGKIVLTDKNEKPYIESDAA